MSKPSHKFRAAVFDLDGTLIDSEEYHWQSWYDAIAAKGRTITHAEFKATFGMRNDAILRIFFGPDISSGEAAEIADDKEQRYRDLVLTDGIDFLPGVRRWLDRLKAGGWQQAIASSAPRLNIEAILTALKMTDQFDAIVSAEDVVNG